MKRLLNNCVRLIAITFIFVIILMNKSNAEVENKTATINLCGVDVSVKYVVMKNDDESHIQSLTCQEPEKLNGELVIPKAIDGLEVQSLGYEGFKNATGITSVVVPSTLNSGGSFTFKGCTNLKEIKFDKDVVKVPSFILEDCTGIEEVVIPDYITEIGSYCFANCPNLKKITLSKNLSVLGGNNFENCPNLTAIEIPKSLGNTKGYVGHNNFSRCTNLKEITFGEGITTIPPFLFYGSDTIEEIEIPDTIVKIGGYAFNGCKSLKEIKLPEAIEEIGIDAFDGCQSMEKITIYDNVKSIGWVSDEKELNNWKETGLENIFSNHNPNLKIYCYKDSFIDRYAQMLGISTVYMTKDHPTQNGVMNLQNYVRNNTYNAINQSINSNNVVSNNVIRNNTAIRNNTINNTKVDNTVSDSILPYTGRNFGVIIISVLLFISGIVIYKKLSDYKEV